MGQRYSCGLSTYLIAEAAGVPNAALHLDVDAICRAYDAAAPIAERLGLDPPRPSLAGLGYIHVSTLTEVVISYDADEPYVRPCIHSPEDIDRLTEPADYMAAGLVARRLELVRQLKARRPEAGERIGHAYEGPVTTATLLMGQDFLTLPYDDPARAHRLLEFCVGSAINYNRALAARQGRTLGPGPVGMPDDFAGMFPPEKFAQFVVPYWEMMYEAFGATRRRLHSELLHAEHLPFLAELKIDEYDPSVNQYLDPEALKRSCPVPFQLRIWAAEVRDNSPGELVEMYRYRASFNPTSISFHLDRLGDEEKIAALLAVACELA